jgi:Leucine-rich repeat (LRR) protein
MKWLDDGHIINENVLELDISNHNIQNIDYINNLPMLQILDCHYNIITQLDNLNLPMLQILNCCVNQITQLDNLCIPMLQYLNCGNNQITQLRLQHVQNLQNINYSNNMIEFIAPNILRVINNAKQNVYTDHQNVHNHNIQECIRKSISNIINIPPTIQSLSDYIVNNTILTEQSKQLLFEYIEDKTIHSTLLITFEELLLHTMSVIDKNEHMDEILKIMNIELDDSLCKCYTGRMSRIINCLNGFSDLVQVQISESEQIGQIISIVKDMLIDKNEYTIEKHKELASAELVNRGYSDDTIEIWISYIE